MKINTVHHRFFYGLQITFRFQIVSKLIMFRLITAINLTEILPMQPNKEQLKNKLIYKCSTDINYEISEVVAYFYPLHNNDNNI